MSRSPILTSRIKAGSQERGQRREQDPHGGAPAYRIRPDHHHGAAWSEYGTAGYERPSPRSALQADRAG